MSKQMEAQLRQAKTARAALQDEVVRLKRELKEAQMSGVPEGWKLVPEMHSFQWPVMPPSKGQSPVLFEDGYAEGWAKCLDECQRAVALTAAPEPPCSEPVIGSSGIDKACQRYTEMLLDRSPNLMASRDDTSRPWRPSGSHVLWMLEQIPTLSPAKAHRWLGFVQCALVSHGLTNIDAEREATRGMFDEGAANQESHS